VIPSLVGVVVLAALMLRSHLPWPLVLLAILAIFMVSFITAYSIFGARTVLSFGRGRLKWKKCKHCTGGGQWLNPRTSLWQPIPKEIRIANPGGTHFNSPQANIRRCPRCQLGGHWYDPGYEPKDD